MGGASFRKFVSALMVAVLLTISLSALCHGAGPVADRPGTADAKSVSHLDAGHSCPCTPDDHGAPLESCDHSCNCACHAPLSPPAIRLICARLVTPLVFHEPFTYLPEVFLSRFIPPRNHA